MNLNELNSRINLPRYCSQFPEYAGFQYVKMPIFGWFGFNPERSQIINILDTISGEEGNDIRDLYSKLTLGTQEFQDQKILYSEAVEHRLAAEYTRYHTWRWVYETSVRYMETHKVMGRLYGAHCETAGYPNYKNVQIGVLTEEVIEIAGQRGVYINEKWKNKMLIPTFCTPNHICSLEVCSLTDLEKRTNLWVNVEMGWYGTLGQKLLKNLSQCFAEPGNTWDSKCDYWNNRVINLSPMLGSSECLKIWSESKSTVFTKFPLDVVLESPVEKAKIKEHIHNLTYKQVAELETKTEQNDLLTYWKASRSQETTIEDVQITKKHNCYFAKRYNEEVQMTNFTVEVDKITTDGVKHTRHGHVYYNEHIIPFEFPELAFSSGYVLVKRIKDLFFSNSVGVPMVLASYQHLLPNVVDRFNEFPKFETVAKKND